MQEKKNVKINVSPERVEARYSDIVIITKNSLGFNFDFGQRMPGGRQVTIVSRVAMSPQHAKLLSQLLSKNVESYEKKYGDIKIPKQPKMEKDGKIIHFMK